MAPPNTLPTFGFPKVNARFVEATGLLTRPWYQFLRDLAIQRGALVALANSAQALPSGTPTPVAWDLVTWDVGGFWNSTMPTRVTVPNVPVYKLMLKAGVQVLGTSTAFRVEFQLNGGTPANGLGMFSSPGDLDAATTLEGSLLIKPGDYVELVVTATGAGLTLAQYQTFMDVEVLQ